MIAIIPARGNSKRFKRKNLAILGNHPLIYYAIKAARDSGVFKQVILSTEDPEIAEAAMGYGARVMGREPQLYTDKSTVSDVVKDVFLQLEEEGEKYTHFCILLPTTPLRSAGDIKGAYDKYTSSEADYLMSTADYLFSPFRALHENDQGQMTIFWGREYLKKDQDLPHVECHNGAIIMGSIKQLIIDGHYYGRNIIGYHMPLKRSVDINTREELKLAQCYFDMGGDHE